MTAQERLTKQQRYQLLLTAAATVGGIVTVLIGIISYRSQQEQTRTAQIEELKARVWEQRLEVYSRIARDVATIAITFDADPERQPAQFAAFQEAARRFKQGYWGDMSLIEDALVEMAMVFFKKALDDCEQQLGGDMSLKSSDMKNLSYLLAHVFRKSLSRTWNPQHAFDKEVLIDKPLHEMYRVALSAGLDVEAYEEDVARYDK